MINAHWEVFEGQQFGRKAGKEARVTLNSRHVFYLNMLAYEALGTPEAVELMYDGNRRWIGIRAVEARQRNAFKISMHGKTFRRINAAAFCQHFRLRIDGTILFRDIDVNDEQLMMTLDLAKATTINRGAR